MIKNIFLSLVCIILFATNCFSAAMSTAKIISVQGGVQIQSGFTKVWSDAKVEQMLNVGDCLKTGADGYCEISLTADSKDIFKLDPNTTVKISVLDDKLKAVELSLGKVYGYVSDLNRGTAFEVCTPTATAGARGTGWSVWTDGTDNDFYTFERNIYVKSFDERKNMIKEITLGQGFKVRVGRFQPPGVILKMSESEMSHWQNWRSDFMGRIPYFKNLGIGSRIPQVRTPDQYRQQGQQQFEDYKNPNRYRKGRFDYNQRNYRRNYDRGDY